MERLRGPLSRAEYERRWASQPQVPVASDEPVYRGPDYEGYVESHLNPDRPDDIGMWDRLSNAVGPMWEGDVDVIAELVGSPDARERFSNAPFPLNLLNKGLYDAANVGVKAVATPFVLMPEAVAEGVEQATGSRQAGRRAFREVNQIVEMADAFGMASAPIALASGTPRGLIDLAADQLKAARLGSKPRMIAVETADGRIEVRPRGGATTVADGETELSRDQIFELLRDPKVNKAYQIADAYSRKTLGKPYEVSFDLPESNIIKQGAISRAFEEAAGNNPEYKDAVFAAYKRVMPEVVKEAKAKNFDELVRASYEKMGKETAAQFEELPINLNFGGPDYGSPREMLDDVMRRGNMNVFRGGDPHEILKRVDPATGLSENEMFRAVHDYFGHGTTGSGFGPRGEEAAYASHLQMYSPLARLGMAAETRGQNSFVNYSGVNSADSLQAKRLKAEMASGVSPDRSAQIRRELDEINARQEFAPQAATILPPEMMDPDFAGGMPEYLRPVVRRSLESEGALKRVTLDRVMQAADASVPLNVPNREEVVQGMFDRAVANMGIK